jgi:hypothetical protein
MIKMRFVGASLALALTAALPFVAHAAQGLNGSYYTTGSGIGTLATALSDISTETPAATFTANTVCFPSCGSTTNDTPSSIATFLGRNATGLTPNSVTNLSDHVVVLRGYFDAPTSGNYTFNLQSDDGSMLVLNSNVLKNDYDHAISGQSGTFYLSAGWQPIEILQFEDSGTTGLTVDVNGNPLGGTWIATTAVPEPATWATLILGVAMIGFAVRRRREEMALAA